MIDANYAYWIGSGIVELSAVQRYKISSGETDSYDVCGNPNTLNLFDGKVYADMNCGDWKIYQIDTRTGVVSVLATPPGHQWAPAVYENKVALYDSGHGLSFFDITLPSEEIYSLNTTGNTLTVINPYDGHIVQQSLAVGQNPADAGLSPDGTKLYVLNSTDKTVTVVQTYDFISVGSPVAIDPTITQIATSVVGDNDSNIYVALKAKNGGNGWVKKIPISGAPVTLPVGINPTSIKISQDNKTIYVSNTDSGSVTSIDVAAFAFNSNITAGPGTKLIKP